MTVTSQAGSCHRWRENLVGAAQIGITTLRLFLRNELQNHAAAVAFYFLLSAVPIVFLILWVTGSLLQSPELSAYFVEMLAEISDQITLEQLKSIGLLPDTTVKTVGGLSLLAMLWGSRRLLEAVQSAFRVIFSDSARRPVYVTWGVSLLIIPGAITTITAASIGRNLINFFAGVSENSWLAETGPALAGLLGSLLTLSIAWGLVVLAYSGLPPRRPPTRLIMRIALLCVISIMGLRAIFGYFVQLDHYEGLYSSLGILIFLLFWVFVVSLVFFFWAQCLYAAARIDAIALEKVVLSADTGGGWLDRILFGRRARLNRKYGQDFSAGDIITREGDESQVAFYLESGTIGLYREPDANTPVRQRLCTVGPGEIFGEMAYLLKERRTATAIADDDVSVFVIPPTLFDELLAINPKLSRRVIDTLCERLLQMNDRVAKLS